MKLLAKYGYDKKSYAVYMINHGVSDDEHSYSYVPCAVYDKDVVIPYKVPIQYEAHREYPAYDYATEAAMSNLDCIRSILSINADRTRPENKSYYTLMDVKYGGIFLVSVDKKSESDASLHTLSNENGVFYGETNAPRSVLTAHGDQIPGAEVVFGYTIEVKETKKKNKPKAIAESYEGPRKWNELNEPNKSKNRSQDETPVRFTFDTDRKSDRDTGLDY